MEYEGIDAFVWPEPASTFAPASDALAAQLAWSGVAAVVVLVLGLALAVGRARRGRVALGLWACALTACLGPFAWHLHAATAARPEPPAGALRFDVRAYQWRFEFEDENGLIDDRLIIPAGRPILLRIASVGDEGTPARIHGFSIPEARVQGDVVPGRVTEIWLEARRPGELQIYCDDFCGTGHARMLSTVVVLSQEEWDDPCRYVTCCGLDARPVEHATDAEWGESLFENHGCPACHGAAGEPSPFGPSLVGVAGSNRTLADGTVLRADATYLEHAITDPDKHVVLGHETRMPAFRLPQPQLDALVAHLIAIGGPGAESAKR